MDKPGIAVPRQPRYTGRHGKKKPGLKTIRAESLEV